MEMKKALGDRLTRGLSVIRLMLSATKTQDDNARNEATSQENPCHECARHDAMPRYEPYSCKDENMSLDEY
jgi:uncharacterized protein YqeY